MSKELVISAASHERRVAILEEGQLVEIYIEREKEFALVGSIYKGRVTRVLPGMQSAFVDIGLDGDAFLYVSDVFENLEDYDHGHGPGDAHGPAPVQDASHIVLPGESLGQPPETELSHGNGADSSASVVDEHSDFAASEAQPPDPLEEGNRADYHRSAEAPAAHDEHAENLDERQPESNASAPQNFGNQYNPTQRYAPRSDRGPRDNRGGQGSQDFGRGDRAGNDRGGAGGDRGRGRWGRRGGRRRSGRPQGGAPQGRNLPPSKYASPQGEQRPHDSRGFEPRGQQHRGQEHRDRGFDNRRSEGGRPAGAPPSGAEDAILLPGESLAKYRNKPLAASAPPVVERELPEPVIDIDEPQPPRAAGLPPAGAPRRSTGGLPRWLLAESGPDAETPSAEASAAQTDEAGESAAASDSVRSDAPVSEDDAVALSSGLIEAKQEARTGEATGSLASGVVFEEEEDEEQEEESEEADAESARQDVADQEDAEQEESEEEESEEEESVDEQNAREESEDNDSENENSAESSDNGDPHSEEEHAEHPSHLSASALAEAEADAAHESAEHAEHPSHLSASALAEAEADAAHESAEHAARVGEHDDAGHHDNTGHHDEASSGHEHTESSGSHFAEPAPAVDDSILLPGETRAPRPAGGPREDFVPRDSARIGGNPRSRFQRPFRSGGGRDRGRDNRSGGGGRPDRRGGRPGGRFERRPSGGPHHDRGYQGGRSGPPRRPQLISEMLKAGQDVVIQIAKEPLGKKGARITSHIALPGRFLVYMPTIDHIGVSRKIASADNRSRLRRLVGEARGAYPGGFIVRTAAGGATDEEIRTDIDFLGKTWNEIKQKSEERKSPALLHRDLNLVERILRDYVSDDFTAIWIDSEEEYGKVVEFVSRFQPKLVNRVKLYSKETPIFEEFGIQHELDKALRAKVWLKSGGYIVINHTEALVAIDVNTGKFVGKGSTRLEDTIVKTNLEAVKEIVRQIRLRDLGGIIVVDFIDMEERRNRERVLGALQQALEQDKAPSKALSFNEFGLVCITRKRTKQALERVLCQPCPYCTGSGMVKSVPTLCYEIQAEARKMAAADHENPNLTLRVHPEIAKALKTRESMLMDELEQTSHKHVIIQSDATLHWEQYDIY